MAPLHRTAHSNPWMALAFVVICVSFLHSYVNEHKRPLKKQVSKQHNKFKSQPGMVGGAYTPHLGDRDRGPSSKSEPQLPPEFEASLGCTRLSEQTKTKVCPPQEKAGATLFCHIIKLTLMVVIYLLQIHMLSKSV